MPFLRDASIKQKMTTVIMVITSAVLFLTAGTFILTEVASFRQTMINKMISLAEIVGSNTRTDLIFHDSYAAEETLTSLRDEPHIRGAYIFREDDTPFAQYLNRAPGSHTEIPLPTRAQLHSAARSEKPTPIFTAHSLAVFSPIFLNGERIGTVYLQSDLGELNDWLLRFALGALLILGISLVFAFILSSRFQRLISMPILHLVDTMETVSAKKDFSLRAEKITGDEIGILIDRFNDMLAQIEIRDQRLERHQRQLQDTVAQRTLELRSANCKLQGTVTQLDRAKAEAEAATEAKSRFLANMSHEIRTPMIGVLGMTELLLRSKLSDEQQDMASTIHHSGEALLAILNDILDFSKIEAGKLKLERVTFDLYQTIEDALDLLAERAHAKTLELVFHPDSAVSPSVVADPVRLRQIILNLVGNAIKFTERGEIVLRLAQIEAGEETSLLRFEIRDTGVGISPEKQAEIFESFSQADDSTARHFGGTGLGLAIVKDLVEKMGGRIGVESTPGEGATFRFTVRLETPPRMAPSPEPAMGEFTGHKALIVEDNHSAAGALVEQLSAMGFEAAVCTEGAEALETLQRENASGGPFHLALLDMTMNGLGGLELAAAIHRDPALRTRILLLGPRDGCGTARERMQAGVTDVLFKPLRVTRLSQKVLQALRSAGPARTALPPFSGQARDPSTKRLGGRILLAEDNVTTQRLIRLILENLGCEVTTVANGVDALNALQRESFDVVLMDCQMPKMDGFQAARNIRREGFSLPVVALTANVGKEDIERCLTAQMNDYLAKPFKQKTLVAMVARWLPAPSGQNDRKGEECTSAAP